MASVEEVKEALIAEQDKAAQLAERSFQAIDTITNQANFWLTLLSILLAVIGLIGLAAVFASARRMAKQVAERRINSYISSEEGKELIRKAVEEEVKTQMEGKIFVGVHPKADDGEQGFPLDPKDKEKVAKK